MQHCMQKIKEKRDIGEGQELRPAFKRAYKNNACTSGTDQKAHNSAWGNIMIRTDNHIHTEFDHDGKGKTEEFVKSAVVRGMKHISFTMHSPCPKEIKTSFWGGKVEDMEAYR